MGTCGPPRLQMRGELEYPLAATPCERQAAFTSRPQVLLQQSSFWAAHAWVTHKVCAGQWHVDVNVLQATELFDSRRTILHVIAVRPHLTGGFSKDLCPTRTHYTLFPQDCSWAWSTIPYTNVPMRALLTPFCIPSRAHARMRACTKAHRCRQTHQRATPYWKGTARLGTTGTRLDAADYLCA